jgi:hypothetical protein
MTEPRHVNRTVYIPVDVDEELRRRKDINASAVATRAFQEALNTPPLLIIDAPGGPVRGRLDTEDVDGNLYYVLEDGRELCVSEDGLRFEFITKA